MADIINIGNEGFASARRSQYVDKSGLIGLVNRTLCSEDKFICVTRARASANRPSSSNSNGIKAYGLP